MGIMPPYRRVHKRWLDYGEERARELALAMLWRQHLTAKRLSDEHCPWTGLLELLA